MPRRVARGGFDLAQDKFLTVALAARRRTPTLAHLPSPTVISDSDRLQPLRVPAGWRIDWHKLCPVAPTPENKNYFMGSTHFSAVHEGNRFWIDVEWRPELDLAGEWHLRVEYQPWPRTSVGRRRPDAPLKFDAAAQPIHDFRTRDFAALVAELERWLDRCKFLVVEKN